MWWLQHTNHASFLTDLNMEPHGNFTLRLRMIPEHSGPQDCKILCHNTCKWFKMIISYPVTCEGTSGLGGKMSLVWKSFTHSVMPSRMPSWWSLLRYLVSDLAASRRTDLDLAWPSTLDRGSRNTYMIIKWFKWIKFTLKYFVKRK